MEGCSFAIKAGHDSGHGQGGRVITIPSLTLSSSSSLLPAPVSSCWSISMADNDVISRSQGEVKFLDVDHLS